MLLLKCFYTSKPNLKISCKTVFLRYLSIDKLTRSNLLLSSRFENSSQNVQLVVGDISNSLNILIKL